MLPWLIVVQINNMRKDSGDSVLSHNLLNEKRSRILSRINWLICFHWAIGSVNYWIFPARRQSTFIALINFGVNKQYEKWLSLCFLQQDFLAFSILLHLNEKKSWILSQSNQLIPFHLAITSVNYWIVSAMRQITFSALINSGVNK